jgi:hypothetical protein
MAKDFDAFETRLRRKHSPNKQNTSELRRSTPSRQAKVATAEARLVNSVADLPAPSGRDAKSLDLPALSRRDTPVANSEIGGESEEGEFKIEAILERRQQSKHPIEYLVKWDGFDDSHNSWF